ncbi:MAG: hypothetical protein M1840_006939 [Geoglossum simile]|nr:MAG: hypothetical protein M1840_006939 [Geoglossum simile]
MFRLLAGSPPRNKVFYVNQSAFASSGSSSLHSLVEKDKWLEGQENVVNWSHVDAETAGRLVSFLYWGDYKVPDPELVPESGGPGSSVAAVSPMPPSAASDTPSLAKLDQSRPLTPIRHCLGDEIGLPERQTRTESGRFAALKCSSTQYSYRETLIAHAQVYVLAHQRLLKDLERLALQRMTQTLLDISTSSDHSAVELMDLVEYVYDNTDERSEEISVEPMRKLLSHFIAANFTGFLNAGGRYGPGKAAVMKVVAGGGAFMLDLTRKLGNRLAAEGSYAESLERYIAEMEKQAEDYKQEIASNLVRMEELRSKAVRSRHGRSGW